MPRSILRLTLALALLAAPFGGPASAAGRPAADTGGAVWAFLAHLLPGGAADKNGCQLDPYGRCIQKQPPVSKAGCTPDPFGRCLQKQPPAGKAGCTPDPYGRCLQKQPPVGKAGCRFDPFGRCLPAL